MKIQDFADMTKFEEIMSNWAKATGLATVAVGADGEYISECYNFTDFCIKLTRGSKEGCARCEKCDREGKGIYHCHAGLIDFGIDLVVAGQKMGAVIGGQVLNNYINTEYTEKYNGKMIARLTEGVNQCEAMVKDIRVYTDKFNSIQQRQGILSLNARIEAARAGSAGRGFAVVAQEVENLSKDSKELNQMISEKVDSISKVVREMTETDQNIFL